MNRLVRQMLFMFGPLILRQVTKMWKKREKTQQWNTPGKQDHRDYREAPSERRSNRRPEPETIEVEPVLSEEERNFSLDEDDIMLEEKDLKYVKKGQFEDIEDTDEIE